MKMKDGWGVGGGGGGVQRGMTKGLNTPIVFMCVCVCVQDYALWDISQACLEDMLPMWHATERIFPMNNMSMDHLLHLSFL